MPWHGCACSREYPFQVDVRNHGRRISADGMGPSAREALCTTDDRAVTCTDDAEGRCSARASRPEPGPAPPRRRRTPTSSEGVRPPVVTSKKRRKPRPAHLCPRHQRPAGRPGRHGPLRRARSRAAGRRGHGAGGQAAPSRARLLRPAGAAPAGRVPGPVRPARRAHPHRGSRRDRCGSSSTTPTPASCPPAIRPGGQRLADPRGRPQPAGRGVRRHRRLQGPAAAHQGVLGRAARRGVPRGAGHHRLRLDRDGRADPLRPSRWTTSSPRRPLYVPEAAELPGAHRTGAPVRARQGARPGHRRTAASGWCAATGRRSASTAAAPSSASRWICCSTRTSASSRWAAGPVPASRRSRCARAWRRCWSAGSTRR